MHAQLVITLFRDESNKEKNLLKGKPKGSEATKHLGDLEGAVIPLNGVKGAGVELRKVLNFHDFHMLREAI